LPRKILITGGSGQLGSCLYNSFHGSYNTIKTSLKSSDNSYQLDVTNSKQVESILIQEKPDIIINCASCNGVDKCESDKMKARNVIVDGLANIIKFSSRDSFIIHISSDYVFSGSKRSYSELDMPSPVNYYGKLKLESENMLIGSNKRYAIVRPNVLFSSAIDNKSNFLGWVVRNLKYQKNINVVDDQVSNPTPVELLRDTIESIMLLNSEGMFNIGTADSISRYDFALKIAEKFGYDSKLINNVKTDDLKQLAVRPRTTFLNFDKVVQKLDVDIYSVDYYLKYYKEAIFE